MQPFQDGTLFFITGPMSSSKSERLIFYYQKIQKNYNPQELIAFKPIIDTRYQEIESRNGVKIKCDKIKNSLQILDILNEFNEKKNPKKYIFIDEYQFLDINLIKIIKKLKRQGKVIFISGLDKNFKNSFFPLYKKLLSISDWNIKMTSICSDCKGVGTLTHKIKSLEKDKNIVQTSTIEIESPNNPKYITLCQKCFDQSNLKV